MKRFVGGEKRASDQEAKKAPQKALKQVPESTRQRYEKLKKSVQEHRYNYHVLDRDTIPPEALDSLKKELADIEKEYHELITPDSPTQRVAGEPLPGFEKVEHKVRQWSFNDAFSDEEMSEFDARVRRMLNGVLGKNVEPTYTAELKIDGFKVVLEYREGSLAVAATRGNGKVGENVTQNVRTIESVPLKLRENVSMIVEGEVSMRRSTLERQNKEREKR
ncbi:MAG: hypothetical protein WDZ79_00670, partial [Candidatus Paceibacterota bacterium]